MQTKKVALVTGASSGSGKAEEIAQLVEVLDFGQKTSRNERL